MAQSRVIRQDLQGLVKAPTPEQYQRLRVPLLDGGVRTDKAPVDLALNESPLINNLVLISNQLRADTGYAPFGSFLNGSAFGTVHKTFQNFLQSGADELFLLTTETIYKYVNALAQWQLVPLGATFTSTGGAVAAGGTSITLTSTTGLTTTRRLGLPLDDGQQLPVTITGLPGSNVVQFTPAVPAGRNVPNASAVALAIKLNGSIGLQPCITAFPANNWVFFTNQIDPIFYWDGLKLIVLSPASDLPANTTCVFMLVFHECLLLFATTENGQALPQRVRMSGLANPLVWTPGAGTIAAIYDLLDTNDFLQCADIVGPYLIAYRERSVMRATYLGVLNNILFWEYTVSEEGALSSGSAMQVSEKDYLVGNKNVYTYSADYTLAPVGDAVFNNLFSSICDLNAPAKDTVFDVFIGPFDESWIFYPTDQNATPNKMLRNSRKKNAWYTRLFANKVVSAAPFTATSTETWATAVGVWSTDMVAWNSRAVLADTVTMLLCCPDVNEVMDYDYRTQGDNGVLPTWRLQTKDLGGGDQWQRWDSVRVYGQGVATVAYSLDGGVTFTTLGAMNFGSSPTLQILTLNQVAPYIRWQLSGTDPRFVFFWLEVWSLPESDWGVETAA
jgi:hypothetical protein